MLSIGVRTVAATVLGLACLWAGRIRAAEVAPDGMSPAELKEFVAGLQHAIRRGEPAGVARYMYFPLRVRAENGVIHSYGGVAFEKNFEQIFTPSLRQAVLSQDPSPPVRHANGTTIGNGRVWIADVCLDRKCTKRKICVTAINLGDLANPPVPAASIHPHR